jgi:hypothetical protein
MLIACVRQLKFCINAKEDYPGKSYGAIFDFLPSFRGKNCAETIAQKYLPEKLM